MSYEPEQDQGTRDLVERTFNQLHSENIQNILKAQNFETFHDVENFASRYHNQINCDNFYSAASTKNEIRQLSNKIDELAVELKHEKNQRRHQLDFVPERQIGTRNAPFFKPSTISRYKQSYSQNYRFSRDHVKTRFPTKFPDPQTGLCFYHLKFGNRANKCSKPCTFQKNQTKSINAIDPPVSNIPLSEAISLPKIRDKISGMLLLLDTGACSNFLPLRTNKQRRDSLSISYCKWYFDKMFWNN